MAATESLTCNNCGAPLDVHAGANYVTCTHCGSRLAVKHTESAGYTETLDHIDESTQHMSGDLAIIRLQNELEQVDREWQIEREQYLVRNRDGSTSVPSSGSTIVTIIAGIFAVGFVLFWIATASSMTGGGLGGYFPLFGVGFLILLVLSLANSLSKSSAYTKAEERYRRRRAHILKRLRQSR